MRLIDAKRIYNDHPDLFIEGDEDDLKIAVDDGPYKYKYLHLQTLEACVTIIKANARKREDKARKEDAICH